MNLISAEKLAGLVLAYVTPSGMRKTAPPDAINEMLRMAHEIAPGSHSDTTPREPGIYRLSDEGKLDRVE